MCVGQVPSMPLTRQSWTDSVQRDSVRPGQHAWGWNWGWNPALRGFKVRHRDQGGVQGTRVEGRGLVEGTWSRAGDVVS